MCSVFRKDALEKSLSFSFYHILNLVGKLGSHIAMSYCLCRCLVMRWQGRSLQDWSSGLWEGMLLLLCGRRQCKHLKSVVELHWCVGDCQWCDGGMECDDWWHSGLFGVY